MNLDSGFAIGCRSHNARHEAEEDWFRWCTALIFQRRSSENTAFVDVLFIPLGAENAASKWVNLQRFDDLQKLI